MFLYAKKFEIFRLETFALSDSEAWIHHNQQLSLQGIHIHMGDANVLTKINFLRDQVRKGNGKMYPSEFSLLSPQWLSPVT